MATGFATLSQLLRTHQDQYILTGGDPRFTQCVAVLRGVLIWSLLSQAVIRVGRMSSVAVCLGFRVPFGSFTLISVILFVDLRGIFIVRACHHLWGYTGPDEFSAIETGWRNQWPFNMAPHFLNIGFRFISWWLRYIHFNLIQEFPFLAFLLEGRSSQWLGLGLSARLDFCVNSLSISMVTHWRHHLFLCIWLVLLLIRHTY